MTSESWLAGLKSVLWHYAGVFYEMITVFNTFITFFVFVALVATIVYAWHRASFSFLRRVFGDQNIAWFSLLSIIWIGRRQGARGIQLLAEIAILRSGTYKKSDVLWTKVKQEFGDLLKKPLDSVTIEVASILDLEDKDVKQRVRNYFVQLPTLKNPLFRFWKRAKKKDGITSSLPASKDPRISFLAKVTIKEGFISPLLPLPRPCLKSKDDARVDRSLQKSRPRPVQSRQPSEEIDGSLVDRALRELRLRLVQSCQPSEEMMGCSLQSLQIYVLFEWLIWRPSRELAGQDQADCRLLSYGLSDEVSTLRLVLPPGLNSNRLYGEVLNQEGIFGLAKSLTASIVSAPRFYADHRASFSTEAAALLECCHQDQGAAFLLYEDSVPLPSERFVYTAYLWLLFAPEENAAGLRLERCLAFWEHANLADAVSCSFFMKKLIQKCFDYFDLLFASPDQSTCYRFAFAVNTAVTRSFLEELNARRKDPVLGVAYTKRLIETPIHGYDEFVHALLHLTPPGRRDLSSIIEVDIQNSTSIGLLCRFYAEILRVEFPGDECETLENMLESLQRKYKAGEAGYGRDNYHIILYLEQDVLLGGAIFDYSSAANCGLLEYIAIRDNARGTGIAKSLMEKTLSLLHEDARKAGQNLDFLLAESYLDEVSAATLKFFRRWRFKKLDFNYTQPPLSQDKKPVENLYLIALFLNPAWSATEMSASVLASAIEEYARIAMRRPEPGQDPVISKMLASLAEQTIVRAVEIPSK